MKILPTLILKGNMDEILHLRLYFVLFEWSCVKRLFNTGRGQYKWPLGLSKEWPWLLNGHELLKEVKLLSFGGKKFQDFEHPPSYTGSPFNTVLLNTGSTVLPKCYCHQILLDWTSWLVKYHLCSFFIILKYFTQHAPNWPTDSWTKPLAPVNSVVIF